MIDAPTYCPRSERDAALLALVLDSTLVAYAARCMLRSVPLTAPDREAVQQAAERIPPAAKALL